MKKNKSDYFKILDRAHLDLDQGLRFKKHRFFNDKKSKKLNFSVKNKFFEFVNQKIYLAHITTRENEIVEKTKIMCSSGCLVGSLYCIPVYKNNETEFAMHNLGKYIFQKEVSFFSENNFEPKILLIEIENSKKVNNKIIGLNYLKLGNFHFNVYKELSFLLNKDERKDIDSIALKMIESSKELIFLLNNFERKNIIC